MKIYVFIGMMLVFVSFPNSVFSTEKHICTIEKRLTTGNVFDKAMKSTEEIKIDTKPFGDNYIFSLYPANAECELRMSNPKGGTFLNCWTLDKKHGFRSDRTMIDTQKGIKNTLTYADGEKGLVVQITVLCK